MAFELPALPYVDPFAGVGRMGTCLLSEISEQAAGIY